MGECLIVDCGGQAADSNIPDTGSASFHRVGVFTERVYS